MRPNGPRDERARRHAVVRTLRTHQGHWAADQASLVWCRPDGVTPLDLERLMRRLADVRGELAKVVDAIGVVSQELRRPAAATLQAFAEEAALAARLATCPEQASNEALADPAWATRGSEVAKVLEDGSTFERLSQQFGSLMADGAWDLATQPLLAQFERLPKDFPHSGFDTVGQLTGLIPRFLIAANGLRTTLGVNASPRWLPSSGSLQSDSGSRMHRTPAPMPSWLRSGNAALIRRTTSQRPSRPSGRSAPN